jgi:hypothetical protein
MNDKNKSFQYTYSAAQQEEIEKIRQKYIPREENKMEQLRKLDDSATKPGTMAALAVGVISVLLLGIGMCCTLVWADRYFVVGIIIGIFGLAGAASALPLYNLITARKREKLAPIIIKLSEELSNQIGV